MLAPAWKPRSTGASVDSTAAERDSKRSTEVEAGTEADEDEGPISHPVRKKKKSFVFAIFFVLEVLGVGDFPLFS